ncbi:LA_0442/LA_0875 N-terminal domain-containing protein [Leptospira sanjuanensis]|uniref:LA_0442/LA_0875 N-terminal domain-containing protein n=1 Tax=Leptospira sanjuanensis TaxID=2879643 RepID=UPI001EE87C21|nr:DUF5683 domain-containing protein [Leptospira sanjuanensis]MCG6169358.1 DUF5683 domain-containing protein [Leptospira sanjuanensis]
MRNKFFLISIIFFFWNETVFADILYLKDGRVIFVKVLNQDMDKVTVSNERETWDIEKRKISRISFNEDEEIYVRNQLRERDRMVAEIDFLKKSLVEKEALESQRKEVSVKNHDNAKGSFWRSAVFPGWGQFYREEKDRGYFFSIAAGLSLLFWYKSDQKYQEQGKNLNEADRFSTAAAASGDPVLIAGAFFHANEIRNQRYQAGIQASSALILFFTIYTFNLIDAWLFGRPWNFFAKSPEEKKESIEINAAPDSPQNPTTPVLPESPDRTVPMLPQSNLPGNGMNRWEVRWRIRF